MKNLRFSHSVRMQVHLTVVYFFSFGCIQQEQTIVHNENAGIILQFENNFKILDSAANANPNRNIIACCTPAISFMEANTKIESSSDGTTFGKLSFAKDDLKRWHHWYDSTIKKYE